MKDPAFLFYSSDFLTGTMLLNMEQKGKYITLLCLQHSKGRLSEKDMLHICGSYDADVFGKFVKDEEGFFFNERLSIEMQKRKAYSDSRRNNRIKKDVSNISKTYVAHMENVNENEIENINEVIVEDANEKKVTGKVPMKDWQSTVRNWMRKEWDKVKNQKSNQYGKPKFDNVAHYQNVAAQVAADIRRERES